MWKHIKQTKQAIMDEKWDNWRKQKQALHVLYKEYGTHWTSHTHSCTACLLRHAQQSESATVWPPRQAIVIRLLVTALQCFTQLRYKRYHWKALCVLGGISSSILSVFFTDKLYKLLKSLHLIGWEQICQWKTLTKCLMKCPPGFG